MNRTLIASTLDWRGNTKGTWKALVKDMTPDSTVTFGNGYTATVSGRTVSVTNTTAPVGTMTYDSQLTNAVNTEPLYGAGTAYDSVEAVAGNKTVRIGSVDLGTLGWSESSGVWSATVSDIKSGTTNVILSSGLPVSVSGTTVSITSESSPTGHLYYELATPYPEAEVAQSLSLTTGDNTLSGASFDTTYEGTDYSIPLIRNCKYIYRDGEGNETLLTGSTTNTSKAVVGGQDKLINLTHWFGRNSEPSIEDFYKLYPTWKNYDIPYDQGSVLNYKGTGVETIGFNAYNHSTGTAALLGGNKYQICGTYTSVSYMDIFGNTETLSLDGAGCFTPVNDGTLTVTGGNGTDTCVHLVWSGYKNYGEQEYKWEPFTRNVKDLPILTYFTSGMNGIGDAADELTSEQKIVRIGVVDAGTLTWTKQVANSSYPYGYFSTTITGRAPGDKNMFCTWYSWGENVAYADKIFYGNSTNTGVYLTDSSLLSLSDTELAAALTGCLIYYELATPIVTQLDQPLNLAYPVNDFGTEHSLPQNTTTLTTTDLKALIKYNTDYMRMNSQLSGIFPTVKSLAQQEQDGHIMKKDDTAPNATVGNAFNLIDRNAEGTERQFSFDTAGGTQDITDGTAVAKKSMGTTLNLNQLVHDTNQNVVTGEGQVEVEDAVAGDVTSLVVEGRSLVRNQLVPPSLEETEDSANGVIEVTDAVAGDAKGLVMTAPRSVVVNQLVQNGNFSDGTTGWSTTGGSGNWSLTVENQVASATCAVSSAISCIRQPTSVFSDDKNGHSILVAFTWKLDLPQSFDEAHSYYLGYIGGPTQWFGGMSIQDSVPWTTTVVKITLNAKNGTDRFLYFGPYKQAGSDTTASLPVGTVYSLKNAMIVDLTQYFNGDSALIDSITSWDDLVAYDPRFASYVEYNTGTVAGVTPSVKVSSRNLLNLASTDEYATDKLNPSTAVPVLRDGMVIKGFNIQTYIATGSIGSYSVSNNVLTVTTSTQSFSSSYGIGYMIKCAPNRMYVFSVEANQGSIDLTWLDSDGYSAGSQGNILHDALITNTIVSPANAAWMILCFRNNVVNSTKTYTKPMVCVADAQPSSYEPYHDGGTAQAPAPLFAVGTAADEFEAVSGKLTHNVSVITLDGTQQLTTTSNQVEGYFTAAYKFITTSGSISIRDKISTIPTISPSDEKEGIWNNGSNNNYMYIRLSNTKCTDTATMTSYFTSHPLAIYYNSVTPTEELLTPASISLQTGSNVALQTDGGRTVPFSLTYDGTEFTLPLDSTHKYAFSDNGTKSIVTSATEQAVTGGQDMLVDVTRMFNGDATAIAAITSWNDMAAVMPEYLSNVAYNEGEVVARGGTITTAVWNQIIDGSCGNTDGWSSRATLTAQDGVLQAVVSTSTSVLNTHITRTLATPIVKGHYYYTSYFFKTDSDIASNVAFTQGAYTAAEDISGRYTLIQPTSEWTRIERIGKPGASGSPTGGVSVSGLTTKPGCNYWFKEIMCIDLTEIYGAGHEPSTVGEFEADCAKWGKDLSQYQAYDAGTPMGGSATFSDLHGVGEVKDTQDVVTGVKTVKMASVDLGTLTWAWNASSTYGYWASSGVSSTIARPSANSVKANVIADKFGVRTHSELNGSEANVGNIAVSTAGGLVANTGSTTDKPTGWLYYELAEPTTSSLTPQPLTFSAGLNNVHEEDVNITSTPINMEYTGTDYSIATKSARKYIRTVNGTTELVTGVSSVSVRGGRDNLIDLTRMFGAGLEPGTLDVFYSLFPTWRGYRLPYNKGSLLSFKGTGLKSVGFNQVNGNASTFTPSAQITAGKPKPITEDTWIIGVHISNDIWSPTAVSSYSISPSLVSVVSGSAGTYGVGYCFRAIPGQVYRNDSDAPSTYGTINISWYTYDGMFISTSTYTAPDNAYYGIFILAASTSKSATFVNPCVHLQWSGTRNGDYEPYWDYVRPIPTLTYFPDGMNGRGGVYDEINPRQAVKRFSKVDLGTLEWTHVGNSGEFGYWSTVSLTSVIKKPTDSNTVPNIISDLYMASVSGSLSGSVNYVDCIAVGPTSGNVFVNNGSTTEPPSGWLVYELATPVVTTFPEEISATARISDYGTEECLPVNGYNPVTAPFRGMVLYQDDYARTITKLPENYQSQVSMGNFLQMLGASLDLTIASVWNASTNSYTYSATGDGVPGLIATAITSALTTLNPATSILVGGTSYAPTLGVVTLPDPKVEPITTIQAGTSSYTLSDGEYSHAPTVSTTYTLPAVTDSAVVHEIVVNVLFASSSTTVTFKNSSNVTVEPLSTPAIEDGSLICYLCRWEPLLGAWSIMPIEMGVQAQA